MIKRMSYRSCKWLMISAVIVALSSCQKEELVPVVEQEVSLESDGLLKTVLGKKLENPYSVSNMKRALEILRESNPNGRTLGDDIEIQTTDYYVRFFARTDEELEHLEADSLHLYDYPLDHEIDSLGDYYIDPDLNPEEGKWYYTSVPVDYQFPDIEHEVLEELFLIEEDTTEFSNGRIASMDFLHQLEDEALKLTDNWEEPLNEDNQPNARRKKRNPVGYVRVWDTSRNRLVGVEGVKVRTRRWFSYGRAWTNSSGYYRINRAYRRSVHYKVFFENSSGFKIWASTIALWKAGHHVGKHNRNGYDINIYTNSRAWRFATVNNAVVKYRRFCAQLGVGLPASNLRIAALDKTGASGAPMLRRTWGVFGFTSKSALKSFLWKANKISLSLNAIATMIKFALPDIIIKAGSRNTQSVYDVTFHELAHASHHKKAGNNYWVKYINYIITYGAYGVGTGNNAGIYGIGEMWGNYFGTECLNREYGRNFWTNARRNENWFNPGFLENADNITDLSTAEIFSCLTSSTDTFGDLRNQLKNKTNNDAQVDNAWNNYTDWP
jgi:hypothetical protein